MQCLKCGAENTESATFCGLCMTHFEIPVVVAVAASAADDGSPASSASSATAAMSGAMPGRAARALIIEAEGHMFAREMAAAEPLLRAALDTYAAGGIERGPELETALNNLGSVLDDLGRHDESAEFYQRCLNLVEQRMGPHSPALLSHLENLGNPLLQSERWSDALYVFDRAVVIAGPKRSGIYSGIKKAEALMQLNRFAEAEAAIVAADTIAVAEYGERGEPRCTVLNQWYWLWRRQGRRADAEHVLRLAIDIELNAPKRDEAIYGMLVDNLNKLLAE